jgi:hypothetical protein
MVYLVGALAEERKHLVLVGSGDGDPSTPISSAARKKPGRESVGKGT